MASTLRAGGTTFAFTAIIPGGGTGQTVYFRAHLTDLSDSYSPEWNGFQDMGRADQKYMYRSYSRSASIGFSIIALSKREHEVWMHALNSLTEMTKPIYRSGLGYNGILTRIRIGNFFQEYGIINSITVNVDQESPWIDDAPIYLTVNVEFTVLGEKKPNYQESAPHLGLGKYRRRDGGASKNFSITK
jgi:hypothetical protein